MKAKSAAAPFATAVLLLICALCDGCKRTGGGSSGVAANESSWSSSTPKPVPGIDAASASFITLIAGPPQGVPFVVWSDLPNGAGGHGGTSAGGAGAFYDGSQHASDGRRIDFRATTTDGKSGHITIAGVEYDLAKGSLFLVSTQQNPPTVSQISFDTTGFSTEALKSNPQLRDFFEKHKKHPPTSNQNQAQ